MKLLPDSIRSRTILVLVLGLTVSHLASTVFYSSNRDHTLALASEQMAADRLAILAKVIDASPEAIRPQVAEAISSSAMTVSWAKQIDLPHVHAEDEKLGLIRDSLRPHFGELDDNRLHVTIIRGPYYDADKWWAAAHLLHGLPTNQQLQVWLGLNDASWISFQILVPGLVAAGALETLLSTLVMVAATLVLSIWAASWITAPLASFAQAAERLGMDVGARPLTEDGPKEVRAAARAFNQMQQRIRSFIEDRLQMLAAISHDLRTPITRLRLRTEQLPVEQTQQDRMLADLDEMEQMVSSCLDFAKDEASGEPQQAVDLAALLGTLCDDAADAGYQADFDWDGRLVFVGRPMAMKRLFSNLIDNACRYGGSAKVRAAGTPSGVEVVVEDEGTGIPEDQMENVFKPFFRLEHSRNKRTGGIGLGLANVRTIARAHGGDVRLENPAGGGLRAVVTLPRRVEGPAASEENRP